MNFQHTTPPTTVSSSRMSSSSPPSSAGATATVRKLLALTTPFVQPSGCSQWTPTSVDTSTFTGSKAIAAVLMSSQDPSCYPSGWADVVPVHRFSFSPGVCPSGWVYHSMAEEGVKRTSTANCCESGFNYLDFEHRELVSDKTRRCGRWTTGIATGTGDGRSEGGRTLLVHEAWIITWAASDTSTLSPVPPTLTNSMIVPTWTPGQVIPDGEYDQMPPSDRSRFLPESAQWFLMVGMPIIGALLIGSCVFCCVRSSKKKRREKRAAAMDAQRAFTEVVVARDATKSSNR
ncbi:hypothetical protein TPAR_00203 [Tolypocladium paradoxum]|uniref:Uncharacterized protein n=1 Tax=Tolypocladium paradoxum TaxID=94208 RepID=A0A2S4LB07_9HYPO|nr:hypothetical protein TPAR_00203 [Tolypocladium paradoxum]